MIGQLLDGMYILGCLPDVEEPSPSPTPVAVVTRSADVCRIWFRGPWQSDHFSTRLIFPVDPVFDINRNRTTFLSLLKEYVTRAGSEAVDADATCLHLHACTTCNQPHECGHRRLKLPWDGTATSMNLPRRSELVVSLSPDLRSDLSSSDSNGGSSDSWDDSSYLSVTTSEGYRTHDRHGRPLPGWEHLEDDDHGLGHYGDELASSASLGSHGDARSGSGPDSSEAGSYLGTNDEP